MCQIRIELFFLSSIRLRQLQILISGFYTQLTWGAGRGLLPALRVLLGYICILNILSRMEDKTHVKFKKIKNSSDTVV